MGTDLLHGIPQITSQGINLLALFHHLLVDDVQALHEGDEGAVDLVEICSGSGHDRSESDTKLL
jgi:hypothetical protein